MISRKLFLSLTALLLVMSPFALKGQPRPKMDKVFTISSTSASFEAEGGTKVFTVTSSEAWKISSGTQPWYNLAKGGKTLSLTVDPNLDETDRTDSFTLSSGDKTIRITITQKGQPAVAVAQQTTATPLKVSPKTSLSVSSNKLTFGASGGSQTITVSSTSTWTIGIGTTSWGHLTKNGNKLTVSVEPNNSTTQRTDWFSVSAGGEDRRVDIVQQARSGSTSNISSTSINTVTVTNNADVDGMKGLRIRVSFNVVGMKDKDGVVSCYFYDSDGNALLDKNDVKKYTTIEDTPHVAVSRSFKPTTDNERYTDFDLAIPYEELHLYGTSSRTLSVLVLIWNNSASPHKEIARKGGNTFICTPVISYLKVDGSTANQTKSFTASGGRQHYSVDTNASSYDIWGVPSWCSIEDKTSTGFTLVCKSNTSTSSRNDYLKVQGAGKEIRIDITQSGAYSSYSSSSSSSSRSSSTGYSYSGSRTRSYSEPWFRIGVDGSMDIIAKRATTTYYDPYYDEYYTDYGDVQEKLVFGAGLRARIGRPDHWFNLISGARYMFGDMKGLKVPVLLNWNLLRGDGVSLYIGGGYEFGITDFYKGTGAAVVQAGISGTHGDLQFYYTEQEILGMGLTIYF